MNVKIVQINQKKCSGQVKGPSAAFNYFFVHFN